MYFPSFLRTFKKKKPNAFCIEQNRQWTYRLFLRSFELKFQVDPEYHPLVIGKGGTVITKIRTDFGVQINLPKRGEVDDDVITIQGYEEKAQQAKDAIMAIVRQQVSLTFIYLLCYQ